MKIVIKISFHPFLFIPCPAFPHGGAGLSDGQRDSLAPSLKLPTRQFLYARPSPWGKIKGGTNNIRKNKIIRSVNLFVTKK
jgi:hypothetical protein